MAVRDQISFTLSRFDWTPPDQLVVAGAWHGVDQSDLSASPVLVLHATGGTHRLKAANGVFTRSRNWSAGFIWQGDPESVDRAELEVGSALVELSAVKQGRRRFGREVLPVRKLEQRSAAAELVSVDSDVLTLHAALVKAQDEVAEARDETERIRAHARQERMRRESDVARLHESMSELRQLAQGSLEKEREKARTQMADVLAELAAAKERESEANEVHGELATAQRLTQRAEAETKRLRAKLLAVRELVEQPGVARQDSRWPIG